MIIEPLHVVRDAFLNSATRQIVAVFTKVFAIAGHIRQLIPSVIAELYFAGLTAPP